MVAYVFKRRRKRGGKTVISKSYYARIKLDGEWIEHTICLRTSDKQVANAKLTQLVKEKERERMGIIAPEKQRISARLPISKHLEEFIADLKTVGRSKSYISHVNSRVIKISADCRWTYPSDINADEFVDWRSSQDDLSPKTLNDYQNSFNALLNWMEKQGRIERNPLINVTKVDIRGRQQKRRAFSDEEFSRLIEAADQQRCLYLTAAYTGLRLGELRQLVWADIQLDHERPHIKVRASTTKNSNDATLPLHPRLHAELIEHKPENVSGSDFVFEGTHHAVCARRFAKDIEKTGIVRIDAIGRKLDFHCLRYTFATLLARSGVSQRMAQELMRHSDPRLTANIYTDTTLLPTFEAVHSLPWVQSNPPKGTVNGTHEPDFSGQNLSQDDMDEEEGELLEVALFEDFRQDLSQGDAVLQMAERGGFEPPVEFPLRRFSKPLP